MASGCSVEVWFEFQDAVYFVPEPNVRLSCFPYFPSLHSLPLGLLALNEGLQDGHNVLQGSQVLVHILLDLRIVGAELAVEVLAVGASAHGGAEDGLDEEAVVRLKGDAVGIAEGLGKLVLVVGQVLAQSNACELEASVTIHTLVAVLGFVAHSYLT